MKTSEFESYMGDINLKYGGFFADLSDLQYGYADVLRVTDLDSATGFDGAVLVERLVVYGLDDPDNAKRALECCGWNADDVTLETAPLQMIDAFLAYGYYDPDDYGYYDPDYVPSYIVQCDPEGPDDHDDWRQSVPEFYRLTEDDDLLEWLSNRGALRDF